MAKGKKTGGRQLGTPNKDNPLKGYINAESMDYFTKPVEDDPLGRTQFQIDLADLTPAERVLAELRLLNKSVADLKAVDANINTHNVTLTIEDRLAQLCEEDDDG